MIGILAASEVVTQVLSLDWNTKLTISRSLLLTLPLNYFKVKMKTLQDRLPLIPKFDAEIDLLIEDEDDSVSELEQQTEFLVSASVTIGRLSALIEKYETECDRSSREFQQTLFHQISPHWVE